MDRNRREALLSAHAEYDRIPEDRKARYDADFDSARERADRHLNHNLYRC